MECKTIDHLHDEFLIEVFDLLDSKSILSAALVCKRWCDIIGSTTAVMKKFKLILNFSPKNSLTPLNRQLPQWADKELAAAFEITPCPNIFEREELAQRFSVSEEKIGRWFKSRRANHSSPLDYVIGDVNEIILEVKRRVVNLCVEILRHNFNYSNAIQWCKIDMTHLTTIEFKSCSLDTKVLIGILTEAKILTTLIFEDSVIYDTSGFKKVAASSQAGGGSQAAGSQAGCSQAGGSPAVNEISGQNNFPPMLNSIKVNQMLNLKFLRIFASCQIQSFEAKMEHMKRYSDLMNFLSSQAKLECLKLEFARLGDLKSLLRRQRHETACKLKKLSISCGLSRFNIMGGSLVKFFQPHQATLQELELDVQITSEVLTFVLKTFVSLQSLSLAVEKIGNFDEALHQLQPAENITKLTIFDVFLECNTDRFFLRLFPNLESLSILTDSEDTLRFIGENMSRLKSLTIQSLPITIEPLHMKFSSLLAFNIKLIRCTRNFGLFMRNNPTIRTIMIAGQYYSPRHFLSLAR